MAGKVTKIEVLSLLLYRLDERDGTFDYQDEVLYDITGDHLDALAGGFDNDFYLSKNHLTYYFAREKGGSGDRGFQRFQLFRHGMTTKFAPSFMGYVDETERTGSSEALLDYRIDVPKEFGDIDNLQISFVKEVGELYSLHEQ